MRHGHCYLDRLQLDFHAVCCPLDAADASAVALASEAKVIPNVDSLIDVELSCESSPCSPGSSCIVGDLGVYCECLDGGYSGDEVRLDVYPSEMSQPLDTIIHRRDHMLRPYLNLWLPLLVGEAFARRSFESIGG